MYFCLLETLRNLLPLCFYKGNYSFSLHDRNQTKMQLERHDRGKTLMVMGKVRKVFLKTAKQDAFSKIIKDLKACLLYTSPSPRDRS